MQPEENPTEDVLRTILSEYKNVAVVGLSNDPTRPSYGVAEYLKNHGFHIVPVNPFVTEVLGEKSYKSLLEMPAEIQKIIEVVDIFRRSEDVPPIVEQAIQMKRLYGVLRVIWMQLGVVNEQAAELARKAGLIVVMDKCMRQQHQHLLGKAAAQEKH
ncbi:MAG: CoA-binding protein [Candidatus Bathyarchaeia archaeon]|jgi:predicted CoA-binding protein